MKGDIIEHFILSSGTSVKCDDGTLLIELLTSYEGRYYEAYYVELRDIGDDKTLRNLKIQRHQDMLAIIRTVISVRSSWR